MFATYGRDRVDQARQRLLPVVLRMVQRAQEAGQVRADLRPTDVPLIEFMLSIAAEYRPRSARRSGAGTWASSWTGCGPAGRARPRCLSPR